MMRSRSLLAKVSTLAQSLGYERVLGQIADLTIPELADWAAVDVLEGQKLNNS